MLKDKRATLLGKRDNSSSANVPFVSDRAMCTNIPMLNMICTQSKDANLHTSEMALRRGITNVIISKTRRIKTLLYII